VNGLRVPEVLSSLLYICQVGYLFGLFLCGCSSGSLCFHHASLRAPVFAHPYRCTTFHFPLSAITLLLEVYTCTRTARLLQEVRRDATQALAHQCRPSDAGQRARHVLSIQTLA